MKRLFVVLAILAISFFLMLMGHLLAGVILNIAVTIFLVWGTLSPNSRLFGPIRLQSEEGPWLTIDDGPDPDDTIAILDLLDEAGMKAGFFLIGSKAKEHPDLVREIAKRGHQIGNHTWSHPQASFWGAGPWRTAREIRFCQETLTGILGGSPGIFRAPVGHHNFFTHPVLKKFDLELIGWTHRGYDGVSCDPAEVIDRVSRNLDKGSIILLHQGRPHSVRILRGVIERILERR